MFDNDMNRQSERRGRFLIQEIEEDNEDPDSKLDKNLLFVPISCPINCSKRTKHSSIIMDSKIFHTTRMDSNLSNILFQTFVYEENNKEWKEFDIIWKEFSKIHNHVVEDHMEKIFHYIDKRIDENESDFFYLNTGNNSMMKFKSDDKFKLISDNDIADDNLGKNGNDVKSGGNRDNRLTVNSKNKKNNSTVTQMNNDFSSNIQIQSPLVSPINRENINLVRDFIPECNLDSSQLNFQKMREKLLINVNGRSFNNSDLDIKIENLNRKKKDELKIIIHKNEEFMLNSNFKFDPLGMDQIKYTNNLQTDKVDSFNLIKSGVNICSVCRNIVLD